jgi:hypothetical protein
VFENGLLGRTSGSVRKQAAEKDIVPTLFTSFMKYFACKSNDVGAEQAELLGQRRNAYKPTVNKPKNMGLLGRVQCAWKDKSAIDVARIEWTHCRI